MVFSKTEKVGVKVEAGSGHNWEKASPDARDNAKRAESGCEGMAGVESFGYHVTKFTRLLRPSLRIKTSSFSSFSIVSIIVGLYFRKHHHELSFCDFFNKNLFEIVTRDWSTKISWHEKTEDPSPVLRSLCSGLVENITLGAGKQWSGSYVSRHVWGHLRKLRSDNISAVLFL